MKNASVIIEMTHGVVHFPQLTVQNKTALELSAKPHAVFTDDALTIPPRTRKTITDLVNHPSEWNTTRTVTPLEKLTETGSLLISHSMSTITDKKVAVRVTKAMKTPYLIEINTQIPGFSAVTP